MARILEVQTDTIPPRIFPQEGPRVAIPIPGNFTMEIPTTPLFIEKGVGRFGKSDPVLPIVQTMWGFPIGRDTRHRFLETVFIGGESHSSDAPSLMARISASGDFSHNRSFNWIEEGNPVAEVIVINGKEYSGVSTKGADFRNVRLVKNTSGLYPGNVQIIGLETEDTAREMAIVSNWLLDKGITGEVIWSISRPEKLPWVTTTAVEGSVPPEFMTTVELKTPEEFKALLYSQAREDNKKKDASLQLSLGPAIRYIDSTEFVIINRATTVPFRLSDLDKPFDRNIPKNAQQQEFAFMMNYIFSYLNRSRDPQDRFAYLQPIAPGESMGKWAPMLSQFGDYFAKNLGTQIGRLHHYGVSHKFFHRGNIVADGTFCDLDTVEGPPFGQDSDILRINQDFIKAVSSIVEGFYLLSHKGVQGINGYRIAKNFIEEYISSRWGASPDRRMIQKWKEQIRARAYLNGGNDHRIISSLIIS